MSVHICSPQPVKVEPKRRILPGLWYLGEDGNQGDESQPFCEKCAAFVKVSSRTFELRFYDDSTCGFYDGWYVVGVHYNCKRCGYESIPDGPVEDAALEKPVEPPPWS